MFEEAIRAYTSSMPGVQANYIGHGGFKEVYKCTFPDGVVCALKVFDPNKISERSQREIEIASKIAHVNVSRVEESVQLHVGGQPFVIIREEFLAGGTLKDRMNQSLIDSSQATEIICGLCDAFEETRSNGIVHRDVKPENIMFRGQDWMPILTDFGLARDLSSESLTQSFQVMGPCTPKYASPEQLNNEKALIDWRTDQYMLGVTIFEAITGAHPYGSNLQDAIFKVATRQPLSKESRSAMNDLNLPQLETMLGPYPINRFLLPKQLKGDLLK